MIRQVETHADVAGVVDWKNRGTAPRRLISLFLYGSYMRPEILLSRGVEAIASRPARLDGYRLLIDPTARLLPDPGHCVFGIVTRLGWEEIQILYGTKDTELYLPEPVLVSLGRASVEPALTYFPAEAAKHLVRAPGYVTALARRAEELGFPSRYVAEIAEWGS